MILRRVIEHFRKQEWTAIAIDFLIVVVGYKENKARFSDIWKVCLPEIPRRPTLD